MIGRFKIKYIKKGVVGIGINNINASSRTSRIKKPEKVKGMSV